MWSGRDSHSAHTAVPGTLLSEGQFRLLHRTAAQPAGNKLGRQNRDFRWDWPLLALLVSGLHTRAQVGWN